MTAGRTTLALTPSDIIGLETDNELVRSTGGSIQSLYRRTSRSSGRSSGRGAAAELPSPPPPPPPSVEASISFRLLSLPIDADGYGDDRATEFRRPATKRSASCDRRVRGSSSDYVCCWDDDLETRPLPPNSQPSNHVVQINSHSRRGRNANGGERKKQFWRSSSSGRGCSSWCKAVPRRKLASVMRVVVVAVGVVFSLCALASTAALAVTSTTSARRRLASADFDVELAEANLFSLGEVTNEVVPVPAESVVRTRRQNESLANNKYSEALLEKQSEWNQRWKSDVRQRQQKALHGNLAVAEGSASAGYCGSVQLRRLDVDKKQLHLTLNERTPDVLVPQNVWRRIVNTPGDRLDALHLTVVPFFSAMQWEHDVYGTVAQLNGVGFGKLTSLLAQTVDAASGERLFVADTFATPPDAGGAASGSGLLAAGRQGMSLSGLISHYEVFAAHVRDNSGFDEHSVDPSRRLYIHRGSLDDLHHNATAASVVGKLPQFRFVVVGNNSGSVSSLSHSSASSTSGSSDGSILTALETAVCFLRDGGLIVVDHPSLADDSVTQGGGSPVNDQRHGRQFRLSPLVDAFFSRHGRSIIAPLLSAGNKLYLTTTNFRRKYVDYINDAGDWLSLHIGKTPVRSTSVSSFGGFEFIRL